MITAHSLLRQTKDVIRSNCRKMKLGNTRREESGVFLNKKTINHSNCLLKVIVDFLPFTISEHRLVFLIKDML